PNHTCGVPSKPGPHGLLKFTTLLLVTHPVPMVELLKSLPKLCVPVKAPNITESPTHMVVLFACTSIKQFPNKHCASTFCTIPAKADNKNICFNFISNFILY